MSATTANLVSKISVAKCHGKIDKANLPKGPVLRVMGVARGTQEGSSTFGPYVALLGDFAAVNMETGEEFRAGKAFMPNTAVSLIAGALAGSPDGVEFAFDFGVKKADNAIGYEYTVKSVIAAKESDQMANLKALVAKEAPLAIGTEGGKKAK